MGETGMVAEDRMFRSPRDKVFRSARAVSDLEESAAAVARGVDSARAIAGAHRLVSWWGNMMSL